MTELIMKQQLVYITLLLFMFTTVVRADHFFGGSISWRPIVANPMNRTTATIELKQTYSWANYMYPCQAVTGHSLDKLICLVGCSGSTGIYVKGVCISYDFGLNISTSQNLVSRNYSLGSRRILAYQSSQWTLLVSGLSGWSLTVDINLAVRSDNGQINSSPTTNMAPLVVVPVNRGQTLRVPMADVDGDVVRCRWANGTALKAATIIDECAGVCQDLTGAQLSSSINLDNNCTLVFNTSTPGYYVVAIQIEDFMPSAPNGSALSSIPLQFLVQAVAVTCDVPVIVGELTNGATIQVPANMIFSTAVIAQPGCNETVIDRFLTVVMPSGMASTSTMIALNSTRFSTTLTWAPTVSQVGSMQIYCTVAIDDNDLQSAQYCLNFVVVAPTTTTSTTSTTTSTTSTTSTTTSTTTTTTTSTSTTTAPSTTTQKAPIDLGLLLGLVLGLGLPLCLLLSLLASCCCCPQWCARSRCRKIRRQFWDDENLVCSKCREQHPYEPVAKKDTQHRTSRSHQGQYTHPDDSFQAELSTYQPTKQSSSTTRPFSPFELNCLTATTTTLTSVVSNPMTPTDLDTSTMSSPGRDAADRFAGSYLARSYSRQMKTDEYSSN